MAYAILDVDLARPLPEVALAEHEDGLAVLGRDGARPVHFSLHALTPRARLSGAELEDRLGGTAVKDLEASRRRDAIVPAPPPAAAEITVAVCTHERPDDLAACLRSLAGLDAEVLVVDNAARTDATRRAAAAAGARCVAEPRQGLDFARNRALAEARGDWVAFVDDDARADAEWLPGLREALAENPDAALVTGLVLPAELQTDAQVRFERNGGFRRGMAKLRYHGRRLPGNALYPVGAGMFGAGANMAVRRELMLRLGGFDEALDTGAPLPGGGDLNAFFRVLWAGEPLIYEPRMLVFHRHRRTEAELRRQYRSWGAGLLAYLEGVYRHEPAVRPEVRGMALWWAADALYHRRFGELTGGLAGLGGYARSRRRVAAIRAAHG